MDINNAMYNMIAALSLFNFGRILMLLLGADIYDVKQLASQKQKKNRPVQGKPLVSVIIPAYNEEVGVVRTLKSVRASSYNNYEIIVIDDGSKDRTSEKVRDYIKSLSESKIVSYQGRKSRSKGLARRYFRVRTDSVRIVCARQSNAGKGAAINNAIENYAWGELVMVVDADSLLHPNAIENMAEHFRDPRVVAAAANVKILPSRTVLGVAQRIEYLISYRMKRSLSTFNMEYIIGGVGSTFRRQKLIDCGLYDTDTITEDIDLTLKLIRQGGNKLQRISYAADVITYTEHVMSFKSLVRQRYRWKYGRFQSLKKCKQLFFSRQSAYSKQLTWYQLPYALFGDLVLLVEPILVAYILAVTIFYLDFVSLLWVYAIVSCFVFLMLMGETSESWRSRLALSPALPLAYFFMYILTAVEFLALIKSMTNFKQLLDNVPHGGSWEHVERSGKATPA